MGNAEAHGVPVAEAAFGFAARQRHGEVGTSRLRVTARNFDLRGMDPDVDGCFSASRSPESSIPVAQPRTAMEVASTPRSTTFTPRAEEDAI